MKIKSRWLALFAGVTAVTALAASRTACERTCGAGECPISTVLAILGGPAGCSPAHEPAVAATGPSAPSAPHAPAAAQPAPSTATPAPKPSDTTTAMNPSTSQPATPSAPAPAAAPVKTEEAMFGAGCFWGVEATFRKVPGVTEVFSGYAGGKTKNPTYKDVCTDATGHAEVVHITFDPAKVSYKQLVELFFKMHDPTQVNRQGPDYGTQYRSAIFYYSPEQQKTAQAVKDALTARGRFKRPIATEISPAGTFYKAEEYHQRYLEKHGLDNCHLPPPEDE